MTTTVLPPMPQLSGGRRRAQSLVEPQARNLRDAVVLLDCRQLVAGTSSFADELVLQVLVNAGARKLVVQHASGDFVEYLATAARDHGVTAKLEFQ